MVTRFDGSRVDVPVDEVDRFISEEKNPANEKNVEVVDIALPAFARYPGPQLEGKVHMFSETSPAKGDPLSPDRRVGKQTIKCRATPGGLFQKVGRVSVMRGGSCHQNLGSLMLRPMLGNHFSRYFSVSTTDITRYRPSTNRCSSLPGTQRSFCHETHFTCPSIRHLAWQ